MDRLRKEFEDWYKLNIGKSLVFKTYDQSYLRPDTQDVWLAWQEASRFSKPNEIPDGWVLVPKEPTEEMIDAGVNNTPETPSQDYWHDSQSLTDEQVEACYKAMIEAVEKNDE